MNPLTRLFRKLRLTGRPDRFNRELEEEMSFHRAEAEKSFRAEGMSPEEAHYAAARRFGNDARFRDQSHRIAGLALENILRIPASPSVSSAKIPALPRPRSSSSPSALPPASPSSASSTPP